MKEAIDQELGHTDDEPARMGDKEIAWHYQHFIEIQIEVDRRMRELQLDATNPLHCELIEQIIRETAVEFKNQL